MAKKTPTHALYCVSYRDQDSATGWTTAWFTTWAKADRYTRRRKVSDYAHIDTHEVPRTKAGLCEWLNSRA